MPARDQHVSSLVLAAQWIDIDLATIFVTLPEAAAVVAPAPRKPELTAVPVGSTLTLPGIFLGEIPGHVFLKDSDALGVLSGCSV